MRKPGKKSPPRRYYVYVIELRASYVRREQLRIVYVGSSALSPEERLAKHLAGGRGASRHVRRDNAEGLRPALYRGLNPLPSRDAAKRAERALAKRLDRQGFVVVGPCSPSDPACRL